MINCYLFSPLQNDFIHLGSMKPPLHFLVIIQNLAEARLLFLFNIEEEDVSSK